MIQPCREARDAIALLLHLIIDPEPRPNDRVRMNAMVYVKRSHQDIGERYALSLLLKHARRILPHAEDHAAATSSALLQKSQKVGGLPRGCIVANAAVHVPTGFHQAFNLGRDRDRWKKQRDRGRRQQRIDQLIVGCDATKVPQSLTRDWLVSILLDE